MRSAAIHFVLVLTFAACLPPRASDVYAQTSFDGMLDVAELMDVAAGEFDLANEDAVILYDGRRIEWSSDRRLVDHVHRIIWIGTGIGIDEHGDHRIPYDHANCGMNVQIIRTWRDGQWWTTGSTGIVETLPFEVDNAYDYTNMRETMLLHDGIELPCILEVAYSIEDKEPFRKGTEGIWLFMRENPTVRSTFALSLPADIPREISTSDDVPAASISETGHSQMTYTWSMGPLDAIPQPLTDDPAACVPHVAWSTWSSWNDLGADLSSVFESRMQIDDALRHCLDSIVDKARTDGEKAELIAEFVKTGTRFVDYPEQHWLWSPRTAVRTYSTAYGHRLDRAVLAAALFKEAGLETSPMFVSEGYVEAVDQVPTLARMRGIGVRVSGKDLAAYYDPESSVITGIPTAFYARAVWRVGSDDRPVEALAGATDQVSNFDVRIDLKYDSKKEMFVGSGCLSADHCFNPLAEMQGLSDAARSYLGALVSSLVDGAEVTAFNPARFDDQKVVLGFEWESEKPELDDYDRIPLRLGQPSSGIAAKLPGDAHLFHQRRFSPVQLPSAMSQTVEIRINTKGLDVVYRPADHTISNGAGDFTVAVNQKDDDIIVKRRLSLRKAAYDATEWPDLRSLLLADSHDRNQTLILKPDKKKENDRQNAH